MKKLLKISAVILMALALLACRKESDMLHDFSYNDELLFGQAKNSFGEKFKILWEGLNSNYAIWDYEAKQGLDWDKVYDVYYPKFVKLDTLAKSRQVTDKELISLLSAVVEPLHDGHLFVEMLNHSTGSTVSVSPSFIRNNKERAQELKDLGTFRHPELYYYVETKRTVKEIKSVDATFEAQYNASLDSARTWVKKTLDTLGGKTVVTAEELSLQRTAQDLDAALDKTVNLQTDKMIEEEFNKVALRYAYLAIPGFHTLDPELTEAGMRITYALLDGNIAYLSFNSFKISSYLTTLTQQAETMEPYAATLVHQVRDAWESWFNAIQELHAAGQLGGVIIDVRNNGGGMSDDFAYVLGALVPSGGLRVMDCRFKRGVGRYDYSPLTPMVMDTFSGGHVTVTEPIVVLANARSVSMAEVTGLGTRRVKNAKLIGTRTWGGFCALTENSCYSLTYSGKVGVEGVTPVFVYCPMVAALDLDGTVLEGTGVTPDIEVSLDLKAWNKGLGPDSQLDRAVEYIKSVK